MKRIILTIFAAVAFLGCEDTQLNSPAMQGSLDDVFFKATDARGAETPGGNGIILQGLTADEVLTLRVPSTELGTYTIEDNPNVYASFQDFNGRLYHTDPDGEGVIVINNNNTAQRTLSGTFRFIAYIPGVDTLYAQRGVFYEVPYDLGFEIPDPGLGTGTLFARVDGEDFLPPDVVGSRDEISIRIQGISGTEMIDLNIAVDAGTGNYDITLDGFSGKYTDPEGVTQDASSGNITVIEHDTQGRSIRGTFSFLTMDHVISQGQFNVTY